MCGLLHVVKLLNLIVSTINLTLNYPIFGVILKRALGVVNVIITGELEVDQ